MWCFHPLMLPKKAITPHQEQGLSSFESLEPNIVLWVVREMLGLYA